MNRVLVGVGAVVFVIVGLIALLSIYNHSVLIVPGLGPTIYSESEGRNNVELKVNKVSSQHTQVPFAYQDLGGVCPVTTTGENENFGEILVGDRIISHPGYKITFKQEVPCEKVCNKQTLQPETWQELKRLIREEYKVSWLLDQLPAAYYYLTSDSTARWETGFPFGQMEDKKKTDEKKSSILYNHAEITIEYHEPNPAKTPAEYRIVFFQVQPYSIAYTQAQVDGDEWKSACSKKQGDVIDLEDIPADKSLDLLWTYSVKFVRNEKTTWSQRWDRYIEMQKSENQIHWFSIVNSFMIVLFLTGMVAMIMMRTLNADFRRINAQDPEEPDETGWKLVHGDVFRPPQRPMVFSVLIGSGVQILGMVIISLIFAVLGFLAPANRGLLLTAALVLYVWMGIFGGYASTRVYKMFKGQHWKKNTILTSISFPGVVFLIFFILNFFLWGQHSSGAVPFGTLVALVALWFGISVPLSFLGSYFAWKKPPPEQPVRTNQIPRGIPPQVWYMHPVFSVLLGGILPFGAVFIELFFILASIWLQDYYYLFSFLFIVFVILIVTCAEITIVMCYFQLCSEDYHWWWRSYLTSGASALYMFFYSVFYFATKLKISTFVAGLLYFGYSLIMSLIFFAMTGTIGYYACYWFVRKIYSSVKFE